MRIHYAFAVSPRILLLAAGLALAIASVVAGAAVTRAVSPVPPPQPSLPVPSATSTYSGVLGDIVFQHNVAGAEEPVLFSIDADGSHQQRIHDSWDGVGISPDGSKFLSPTMGPDGRLRTLLLQADGSGEEFLPLEDPTLQLGVTEWSPDGTRVVAEAWDDTDASRKGIYTVSVGGGDLVRLTSAGARHDWPAYAGAYSPDGEHVLYFRPEAEVDADGVSMDLFVVDVDGAATTQLDPPGIGTILYGPSGASDWSPSGTQVAFVGSDGDFWKTDRRAVFIVGADGSGPHPITDWADILSVQWSPDGQRLAFTMKDVGQYQIFTIRADGTDLRRVTSPADGALSFGPMWSPDCARLLFVRGTDLRSQMDLWVVNSDGSNPVQVTHEPGAYGGYEWVP